jgi:hypothetical protein
VALVQNTNYPVKVMDSRGEDTLQLWKEVTRGGGYRYYFKYATQEGNTTGTMSPHSTSNAGLGLSKEQISDRMVGFTLTDLDSSYMVFEYTLHISMVG